MDRPTQTNITATIALRFLKGLKDWQLSCGDDLCVHDFNCWAIKRFTTDGVFVKETVMDPLRDIDFVERSIAGNGDGSRVYIAGVYDYGHGGGRAVFRAAL